MTYLQLETRIMHYSNLSKQIFWQLSAKQNYDRHSSLFYGVAQGSRPRCGPMHPILHSNIFFYIKLFTTIILSWNSLKCILWYLLELSDPFIKNENSVLPILIEKNFEQKIYFCLLKMRSIIFNERKSHFFIFSTSCKKNKIFPFILFEKRRLARGIRRLKAADSPTFKMVTNIWY